MAEDAILVKVAGVYVANTPETPSPVVFLESEEKKVLPIYIGASEAFSIQTALDNAPYPRPLTHDLFLSVLENAGLLIEKSVIDDLSEGVFFSRLIIRKNGDKVEFDARPSDCIALAVRANVPVYVSRRVLEMASVDKADYEFE